MKILKNTKGSIALISILLIAAMTLIIVLGASENNLSDSYVHLNNVSNTSERYQAESCLEEAIIRLEADAGFIGTTLTFDADSNCIVEVIGNSPKIIDITTTYLDFSQNFRGEGILTTNGEANNFDLSKWEKI